MHKFGPWTPGQMHEKAWVTTTTMMMYEADG